MSSARGATWAPAGSRRRVERLADETAVVDDIEVVHRAFELDPTVPAEGMDLAGYLARKFGGADRLRQVHDRLDHAGADVDIEFRWEGKRRVQHVRRPPAHRVGARRGRRPHAARAAPAPVPGVLHRQRRRRRPRRAGPTGRRGRPRRRRSRRGPGHGRVRRDRAGRGAAGRRARHPRGAHVRDRGPLGHPGRPGRRHVRRAARTGPRAPRPADGGAVPSAAAALAGAPTPTATTAPARSDRDPATVARSLVEAIGRRG